MEIITWIAGRQRLMFSLPPRTIHRAGIAACLADKYPALKLRAASPKKTEAGSNDSIRSRFGFSILRTFL